MAQAPFGEWSDLRYQDGCEEASAMMAVRWARGQTGAIGKQEAHDEIAKALAWEEEKYGSYHDTSAADTASRIFKGYYGYDNVLVEYDISSQDIIDELKMGNVVVTPMNGQKLGNPYYTAPGPERHMLVIIGYNPTTKKFITNDPGTRQGKDFQYDVDVFMNAVRDYPSGTKVPITTIRKAMIVVSK